MFVIKNKNNSSIIHIQANRLELIQCMLLGGIVEKIARQKNKDIIINLNQLSVINNFFIEKLIKAQRFCENNNCSLALCGANHDILCIFYLLKLDKYFEFYENDKEAFLRENRFVKRRLKIV